MHKYIQVDTKGYQDNTYVEAYQPVSEEQINQLTASKTMPTTTARINMRHAARRPALR